MKIKTTLGESCDGFSNRDIDGFLQNSVASLVREHAQNSSDAVNEGSNAEKAKPVELDFTISSISTDEIPDIGTLKQIFAACEEMSKEGTDIREQEFFESANQIVGEETVSVLSISDFNTKGVGGHFGANQPFYSLVKTKGTSAGKSDHAGGSFGVGKMSAFACSKLRTVFYSTVFMDGETSKFYCMGRSCVRSWKPDGWKQDDDYTNREFWWGVGEKNLPETSPQRLPKWLQRKEVGLTTHIVGVQDAFDEDWKDELLLTLVSNFYVAIQDEYIRFSINNGEILLNKKNLSSTIRRLEKDHAKKKDTDFDVSATFAKMIAGKHETREFSVDGVGDFRIHVGVEDIPSNMKKVQIVRNGMVITDNLNGFKDALKKFTGFKPFVAILRPKTRKAPSSNWLKRLEGPAHDILTVEYLQNDEKKKEATELMHNITKNVKEILRDIAASDIGRTSQLTELDKYLRAEQKDDGADGKRSDEPDPLKVEISSGSSNNDGQQKGFSSDGQQGKEGPVKRRKKVKIKKRGTRRGRPGSGKGELRTIDLEVRSAKIDSSQPKLRKVSTSKAPASGELEVTFYRTGRNGDEENIPAQPKSATDGKGKSGSIVFSVSKGDQLDFSVNLEFDAPAIYAVAKLIEKQDTAAKKVINKLLRK